MKKRRSVHQTQWTAQFAVASELSKRGYQVALTLGNHPTVDLMVVSPSGKHFLVDVKGQYSRNFWPVKRAPKRDDLFYVLAYVPDSAANQFFVMTQEQVEKAIEANTSAWLARKAAKGITEPANIDSFTGVEDVAARQHENAWDVLPK
jgi:hypothetical protein